MSFRPLLAVLVVGCAAVAVVAACTTDYQKGLEDPNYGGPNALVGEKQPPTSSELAKGSSGGGEGGASSGGATIFCVKQGGTLVDGGTCAVSWSKDLAPAFGAIGGKSCSDPTCHGTAYQPNFDLANASGAYSILANFPLSNGTVYLNPCSTDPTKSSIECNLAATNPCGTKMPQDHQLPPDVLTKIDTWVKCASPNN